jgi:hypothetical protein
MVKVRFLYNEDNLNFDFKTLRLKHDIELTQDEE